MSRIESKLNQVERELNKNTNKTKNRRLIILSYGYRGKGHIRTILGEDFSESPEEVVIQMLKEKAGVKDIGSKCFTEERKQQILASLTLKEKRLYEGYLKEFTQKPLLNEDDLWDRINKIHEAYLKRKKEEDNESI